MSDAMPKETLAHRLGATIHLSLLRMKARRRQADTIHSS